MMTRFKRFLVVAGIVFGFFLFVSNEVDVSMIMGLFVGLLSLPFDTKAERLEKQAARKAKEEARKREEEARKREKENRARSRRAPGCHSMDNVDILTFSSSNNLFTAGNNAISMRIRNKNSYDVIVSIRFKYSDSEGWDSSTQSYEVGGNKIRNINTLGTAWRKAKDVSIVAVH